MKRTLILFFTVVGVAMAAEAGFTTHLKLDCRTGSRTVSADGETLCFDTGWYDNATSISITDNGEEIGSGTMGALSWKSDMCGSHVLQLETVKSDGAKEELETAEFSLPHVEEIVQPAVEPVGTSPGYTAEIKCSRCGKTLQERTAVWADGVVAVSGVTAQQRYPWNGLVDIVVTLQGDVSETGNYGCKFVATNSATQAAVPVTAISRVGDDAISGDICTRRYLWNAATDVGAVRIDGLVFTVVVQKKPGGVQLWENGPYWAKCNVGATKPEEYGYYFWWGDTVGYKRNASNDGWVSVKDGASFEFYDSNCPTDSKDNSTLQSQGYIDSTGGLVAAHDAATAH